MRIAIVHPYCWPDVRRGAERYMDDLSRYLAKHGHQVTIITGTDGPAVTEVIDGITFVRRHQLRLGHRLAAAGEVETFGIKALVPILRARSDVVHGFTPTAALAGVLARRPTLYTVLGHPDASQFPPEALRRRVFVEAVRRSTVTACLSHASADALASTCGRQGLVLPPGVVLSRFPLAPDPRPGPARFVFSASLADPRKRVDLCVRAFAEVLDNEPQARLGLSGAGDVDDIMALARSLGDHVAAAVEPMGPGNPEDVPARYRQADVTVMTAEHEAFGLVVVESLSSGTPVAISPSGGMPELVGTTDVGAVAASATVNDLADAMLRALALSRQRGTADRCAQRAQLWDWEQYVGPGHEQLYAAMAARGALPVSVGPW